MEREAFEDKLKPGERATDPQTGITWTNYGSVSSLKEARELVRILMEKIVQ